MTAETAKTDKATVPANADSTSTDVNEVAPGATPPWSTDTVVTDETHDVVDSDTKSREFTPVKSKRRDDWGGVMGADGTHYYGTAHQSLTDALKDDSDTGEVPEYVYAKSVTFYDPETRNVAGQRWEAIRQEDLPVGGAIPGEWKRVKVVD
jgi:hypothetical protein